MRLTLTCLLTTLLFFLACKRQSSPQPDDKLASLYAELILLNEEYKHPSSPLTREEYDRKIAAILKKYDTSKEEFSSRLQTLSADQERFQAFHQSVSKKLLESRTKQ